jgi:hypothetical protein
MQIMVDQLKLIIDKAQKSHETNNDVKLPNLIEDIELLKINKHLVEGSSFCSSSVSSSSWESSSSDEQEEMKCSPKEFGNRDRDFESHSSDSYD